jgi:hypothetical protein
MLTKPDALHDNQPMNNVLLYRLSLGLTVILTLIAFFTLLGWFGALINGVGRLPLLDLIPWNTLILIALAGINCIVRARLILRRSR